MGNTLYANLLLSFNLKYNTLSHVFILWSNFVFDSHYFPEMLLFFFFFFKSPEAIYQNEYFFSKKIPFRKKEVEENKGKQPVTMTHYVPYKL